MLRPDVFPGFDAARLGSVSGLPQDIRVVLLDIEGTTTPISFVHERLFSYAREHLDEYLARNFSTPVVQDAVRRLAAEHAADKSDPAVPGWRGASPDATRASVSAYARWLMERDRKSPGLKLLQGVVWEEGYRAGKLRGEVFDDVPAAMRRWHDAGLLLAIYSSGSQLAQRRLFASTQYGDLTPLISGFFDTAVGPKIDPDSYRQIAAALTTETRSIIFLSDVAAELAAARAAGCETRLCVRPGNAPQTEADRFIQIRSFQELQ